MTRDELRASFPTDLASLETTFLWLRMSAAQRAKAKALASYGSTLPDAELDKILALIVALTNKEQDMLSAPPQVTKKQAEDAARAMGFDPAAINWQQIIAVILAILNQILNPAKAKAKAAACPAHDCLMHDTACLNLQAAANCLQCCEKDTP